MKFLEKFTLVLYSLIILILSVVLCLLIFNWMDFNIVTDMVRRVITGEITSKFALGFSVIFILLSVKCMFFDDKSSSDKKSVQGILLKNENGQLLISKETINNIVEKVVMGFENVKQCNIGIDINSENQLKIIVELKVNENIVIKELVSNIQLKVKEEIKRTTDLEVQEVNIKIKGLADNKLKG